MRRVFFLEKFILSHALSAIKQDNTVIFFIFTPCMAHTHQCRHYGASGWVCFNKNKKTPKRVFWIFGRTYCAIHELSLFMICCSLEKK